MKNRNRLCLTFLLSLCLSIGFAQTGKTSGTNDQTPKSKKTSDVRSTVGTKKLSPQQRFVEDVVGAAVALPQANPQDRLRVLTSAANVISPINRKMEKKFAREGTQLEAELLSRGEKPIVSIVSAGHADCGSALEFVERIPPASVPAAEQSLVGLIGACPKEAKDAAREKLERALNEGWIAPRALLAMMETVGPSSRWSQVTFEKMFSSLPSDAEGSRKEAPNFGAMYVRMAPKLDKDIAKSTGLKLMEWLAKLNEGAERNLAVNMVTGTMQKVLGDESYQEALRGNIVVQMLARTAGQPGEVEHPPEENVSVLAAMGAVGQDQTEALKTMSPSLRAREAAAHGFATGTGGDRGTSDRYFDVAFSALDEVWADRASRMDAPAIVEEVSEAAAQVDAVAALKRAQALQDVSSQAIGMIAVARVVVGQQSDAAPQDTRAPGASRSPIK